MSILFLLMLGISNSIGFLWMASFTGPESGPDRTGPISGRSVNVMSILFIFLSLLGISISTRLFVDGVIYQTGVRIGHDRTHTWSEWECDVDTFYFSILVGTE